MNIKHSSLSNNIYEKNLLKNKYMYFADWQANNGDFEYFLQYLFHFFIFEGDIVIDVGANHALHTIPLGNIVGSKGKVFAFEAIPENVKLIKNLTEHLSVTVFHSAVTNENTAEAKREIIFNHVINNDGYSGIKENPDISQIETIKKIKCPTTTLDRSIPENHTIKFIKIDVEGGEFHVLQGAKRILRKSKPIIAFENGRQQSASLYEYTKEDFFSFFKAFKYRIFCLTGEEITEESWDQENILWEFLAVHEDSPYIYFFENNLFYLANIYTERQRQYAEIIRTQALSCFKNSIPTDYANPDTKRDAALQPCRKLYLHIGLPALDTVRYLQRALFRNRDILHSLDIFCPSEGEGQAPITPWDRDGGLADCVRDWNASGCSTAVFSHEAAVWTPPERYAFLAEQAEVRIVLHLPSPLFWLEAQQRDITEHALDWYAEERFPAHPRPDVDTGLLGLADWLRRWREYYPNGTCLVKNLDALETPEHVLQDFLELLGIADASTRFDTRVIPTRRHLNTEHLHFLAHTHFMPLSSDDRRGLLQSLHALSEAAPETPRLRLIREIPAAPALEALNAEFDILVGDPQFSANGRKRFENMKEYAHTDLPVDVQNAIFCKLPATLQASLKMASGTRSLPESGDVFAPILHDEKTRNLLRKWSLSAIENSFSQISPLVYKEKENTIVFSSDNYKYTIRKKEYKNTQIETLLCENIDLYYKTIHEIVPVIESMKDVSSEQDPTLPHMPYWNNGYLSGLDIISLCGLMLHFRPEYYFEVGSGNSTKFIRKTITTYSLPTKIISIDPFPRAEIDQLCDIFHRIPFENLSENVWKNLSENSLVFIDNSHRALQNSDVTTFFMDMLPSLPAGTIVGLHDIHLPYDYPEEWIDEGRLYNEQYMLASFLIGGHKNYDILLPCRWLCDQDTCMKPLSDALHKNRMTHIGTWGSIFWLRKK